VRRQSRRRATFSTFVIWLAAFELPRFRRLPIVPAVGTSSRHFASRPALNPYSPVTLPPNRAQVINKTRLHRVAALAVSENAKPP
jgi:hypothetical protein